MFPHSDMYGSRSVDDSPYLFAVFHVLLRRLVPRHPPYALCSLILLCISCLFHFRLSFAKDSYILWHNENCYIIHITLKLKYLYFLYAVVNVRFLSHSWLSASLLNTCSFLNAPLFYTISYSKSTIIFVFFIISYFFRIFISISLCTRVCHIQKA